MFVLRRAGTVPCPWYRSSPSTHQGSEVPQILEALLIPRRRVAEIGKSRAQTISPRPVAREQARFPSTNMMRPLSSAVIITIRVRPSSSNSRKAPEGASGPRCLVITSTISRARLPVSRSALAQRFTDLVGEAPMRVLSELAHAAHQADDARRGAQYPGSGDPCRLRLRSCVQPARSSAQPALLPRRGARAR